MYHTLTTAKESRSALKTDRLPITPRCSPLLKTATIAVLSMSFLVSAISTLPLSAIDFAAAAPPSITRPIRIGIMGAMDEGNPVKDVLLAAIDGAQVAVFEENLKSGGINGRKLEVIVKDTNDEDQNIPSFIDTMLADDETAFDAMAFMPGRGHVNHVKEPLERHKLVMICPVAGDRIDFQDYHPNLALITPIPDAEVEALIRYVVLNRHLKRIAITTTYKEAYGNELIPMIKRVLAQFGLEISYHFLVEEAAHPFPTNEERAAAENVFTMATQAPAHKRPQALLVIGGMFASTATFLAGFMAWFPEATIGTPGLLYVLATMAMMYLPPPALPNIDIVTTQYVPLSTDTSYAGIRELRNQFPTAYVSTLYPYNNTFGPLGVKVNYPLQFYDIATVYSSFMTGGYLITKALISVMKRIKGEITAESILNETFSSTLLHADDVVFGPYSRPCDPSGRRTVMCNCNSGARQVFMSRMNPTTRQLEPMNDGVVSFTLDTCLPEVNIQSPLIQLIAAPTLSETLSADQKALITAAASAFAGGDKAGYINLTKTPSSRTGIHIELPYATTSDLAVQEADYLMTVSTGSTYEAPLDDVTAANITIALDPLFTLPPLHSGYTERVIHLSPTLQQEIHALASVFAADGMFAMTTASSADFVGGLADAATRSANTFGFHFGGVAVVDSIAKGLGASGSGTVLIHGIRTNADIAAISAFLARHEGARVLIPFHHIVLWYDALVEAVTDPKAAARVLFATNLPSWNPTDESHPTVVGSDLMKSYFAAMKERSLSSTPQTLRGYLTQRLVANIVERIPSKLTQETFLATLFAVSVVVLDANAYSIGPLSNVACGASKGSTLSAVCETNTGARQVFVRSLRAATLSTTSDASERDDVGQSFFSGSRIDYRPLPTSSSQTALIAIIASVAAFVVILFVVTIVVLLCFTGRSHGNAPKDVSKPFTLVFTDIQSSTSLWAEVPDDMAKSLDVHHALMRTLIKQHRGYEVKTIGDSFMIAFKEADDAVRFSYDMQHTFFNCDLFPPTIDRAYLSFDKEKIMEADVEFVPALDEANKQVESGDHGVAGADGVFIHTSATAHLKNLTANLSPEEYSRLWRGIRVRAGINTAFGDIKKDEVTKAYDYYGTVTNTAARVESVANGGQVLFTSGTHEHLSPSLRIELYETDIPLSERQRCTAESGPLVALKMGAVALRGLSNDVVLYQLECVAGRVFPPLRLDKDPDEEEEEEELVLTTSMSDRMGSSAIGSHANPSKQGMGALSPGGAGMIPPMSFSPSSAALEGPPLQAHGNLDTRSEGPSMHSQKHKAPAELLNAPQFMAAIATLFSIIPAEKRGKEMRRLCELWRISVDEKKLLKRRGVKKQDGLASSSFSNSDNGSRNNNNGADHKVPEPYARLTGLLTGGDGLTALCLEALARRLKTVASKKLSTAMVTSAVAPGAGANLGGPQMTAVNFTNARNNNNNINAVGTVAAATSVSLSPSTADLKTPNHPNAV